MHNRGSGDSVLYFLFVGPLLISELVELVSLPIDGVDAAPVWVSHGRNLEWEQVVLDFIVSLLDFIGPRIQEEGLVRKAGVEASYDQDFLVAVLADSGTLSRIKNNLILQVQQFPCLTAGRLRDV